MNSSANLNNNLQTWRILVFGFAIIAIFLVYLGRLFSLQILENTEWVTLAEENRISRINLPTQRGIVFDRNDYILAQNIPSYNVVVIPSELPDDLGEIQEIYRRISEMVGVPINLNEVSNENPYVPCRSEHGITQIVEYGETTAPYAPVRIKCNVDRTTAMIIKEKAVDLPGVDIEIESVRDYPTGSLTAGMIGFTQRFHRSFVSGRLPAWLLDRWVAFGQHDRVICRLTVHVHETGNQISTDTFQVIYERLRQSLVQQLHQDV